MGDHGARQLTPILPRRLVKRNRQGGFQLNLNADDRVALRQLAEQFEALLDDPDQEVLHRLFPPAYSQAEHTSQEEEYRRLMRDDLVERHRDELNLVAATAEEQNLSEEQLLAWTRAINSVRLVLGTYLDVSEDDERNPPATPEEALYHWLSYLLGEAIDALAGQT